MQKVSFPPNGPWILIPDYPLPVIPILCPLIGEPKITNPIGAERWGYKYYWDYQRRQWRIAPKGVMGMHRGVDFALPVGSPIFSPVQGMAEEGWDPQGYGLYIKIRFKFNDLPFVCYLAHLADVRLPGYPFVPEGDSIGFSGNTGKSTGPHLHLEIRRERAIWPNPFEFV